MTTIGAEFRALHQPGTPFILANAWDLGSAQLLAALGAKAIGTTSAGHAFTLGRPDMGHVTREVAIAHAAQMAQATGLPISGDLENGYGPDPQDVADTVRMAGEAGLAGCSIEDTDLPASTVYDFNHALERIEAGVQAARALDNDFVFCARADGMMNGIYDFDEGLRRLKAFERAGADCLYAPLPPTMEDVKTLCAELSAPVNILAAGPFLDYDLADFAAAGAARVSLGSSLARKTHAVLLETATAVLGKGNFSALKNGAAGSAIDTLLLQGLAK